MIIRTLATSFLQNLYALLITGLLYAIALSMNNLFIDIKNKYFSNRTEQIVTDFIYFLFLLGLLLLFVFLYRGSFDLQKFLIKGA